MLLIIAAINQPLQTFQGLKSSQKQKIQAIWILFKDRTKNPFFDLIFNGKFSERMDSKIKHIIIGYGIGSAQQGNWRFIGSNKNIFDYIEKNVPKGETVLAMVCEETANYVRPGLGTQVNISLQQADKPGKIIKAGERRIIGTITQYSPKIQYF